MPKETDQAMLNRLKSVYSSVMRKMTKAWEAKTESIKAMSGSSTPLPASPVWNLQLQNGTTEVVNKTISDWIDANFNKNNEPAGFIYTDAYNLMDPYDHTFYHYYDVKHVSATEFIQINKSSKTERKVSLSTLPSSGNSTDDLSRKMNEFTIDSYDEEKREYLLEEEFKMLAGCYDQLLIPITNEFKSLASAFSSAFTGDFTTTPTLIPLGCAVINCSTFCAELALILLTKFAYVRMVPETPQPFSRVRLVSMWINAVQGVTWEKACMLLQMIMSLGIGQL